MLANAINAGHIFSKSSRPQNVLYSGILAVLVTWIQGEAITTGILCYALIVLLYALATNFNNISDRTADGINERTDNPHVYSQTAKHEHIIFTGICFMLIVLIQFQLKQPVSGLLAITYLVLSYAYSDSFFRMKSKGLYGTLILCFCYGSFPIILGALQGTHIETQTIITTALLTSILIAPLILAKDYKDYRGDKLTKTLTPLVQFGYKRLAIITYYTSLLAVLGYLILVVEYVLNPVLILMIPCYLLLIHKLHKDKGHLAKPLKSVLFVLLLVMPVSVLIK